MTAFTLLLAGVALAYAAATWFKIPAPPLLVGAGIAISASGAIPDSEMVNFILSLGVTVLLFVAGAELSPSRFAQRGAAAAKVGLAQFVALGAIGFGVTYAMGFGALSGAYTALALAASSTFVVVRLLKHRRRFYEPFGQLVLGVLLLQDVLVVLALAALTRWEEGQLAVESALFRSMTLLLVAWVAAKTIIPWLLMRLKLDEEAQLIIVLAVLFVFAGAAFQLDVPIMTGAFCAGFAVSSFPVNAVIRGQLTTLSDFFVALFFVALGAVLVLPSWEGLLLAFALIAAILVGTPLIVAGLAERSGMTARASLESGLLLAQTSEFSLVVVLLGANSGHLPEELIAVIALVTMVTMVLTPFLATEANVWRLVGFHPSRFREEMGAHDAEGHVVVLGVGRSARKLVQALLARGDQVVVVDHDPVVCGWAEGVGATAVRAEASDPKILDQVRAQHASVVVSTLHSLADNCRIVSRLSGVPTVVRVYEASEVEAIESAGGIAVPFSDAAADAFLAWVDGSSSFAVERSTALDKTP